MTVRDMYPTEVEAVRRFLGYLNRHHDGDRPKPSPVYRYGASIAIEDPETGIVIGEAVVEDTFWVFRPAEKARS